MRLDRVLSEGEAQIALRRMVFVVREAQGRPGLYEIENDKIGGIRVMTVEQLCSFAEGAVIAEQLRQGVAGSIPN